MERIRIQLFALYFANAIGAIIYILNLVVSPFELTFGSLLLGVYWFMILLLPALIPIVFDKLFWRYVTLIIGVLLTLINLVVSIGYLLDNQLRFGLLMLLYWGILGITATLFSRRWIKQ